MRRTVICILISLYATLAAANFCVAQQAQPQPPVFSQIFKQPTGKNGYEDLVQASDILAHSPAMDALQAPGVTLTTKRRAITDPDLQQALALIWAGLEKPVAAPGDPTNPETPLPLLRLSVNMLSLGRLLAAEQSILLADGQTARAIQNLRDGLRLGYAVRCLPAPVSDRVGMGIDSMLIDQIARHANQFSEHDCDSLLQLIQEWLDSDHSPLPALISERDHTLKNLGKTHQDPGGLLLALQIEAQSNENPAMGQLLAKATPASLEQAADAAAAMYRQQFDFAIVNLRLAPWQRQDWKMPDGNTLAYRLYRTVAPDFNRMLQYYDEERAKLQLLGAHIAIRKYRWQYDCPPDRLEQLRNAGISQLESLITDPFSGKPLGYRRHGDDYDLYSVGPYAHDDTGARIPDKHTPISLAR